ncbi:DNA polymerase III subunit gamma/tau [Candidatus Gracilibacteria bacterium]|nr:DNA polymerase III subunit gamma/tau [Candidatus Gracilibacteria bacterium]
MSALFLKYRPQTFTDLVGQTSVVKTLRNALKIEKPSHAYLFSGSRGTGKTSTARIFAKGLTCQNLKQGNPCGTCNFCRDISEGNLVDVIEIDAASNRGIDEIRELREKIQFAPNRAQRKVYIIDEAHMLTKEAFNALLKTLEEPPEHAFFLLATTEKHKLPETIISRCQNFIFNRFTLEQLIERLGEIAKTESFDTDQKSLELIARKAEGGLRDAISLLEQIAAETENKITPESVRESLGISDSETLSKFWSAILNKSSEDAFKILKEISKSGKDFRTFGHDFLGFLRDKLHENLDKKEVLDQVLPAIEEIEIALSRLKTSPIVDLPLEIAVVNLCSSAVNIVAKEPAPVIEKQVTPPSSTPKAEVTSIKEVKNEEPKPKEDDSGFIFSGKTERSHQKIEKAEAENTESLEISFDSIKEKMNEIAEKAGIPSFAKKSFLSTQPEFSAGKIVFRTESAFHLEKINTQNIRAAIQSAMIEIFGQKLLIDFGKLNGNGNGHSEVKQEVATADDFLQF